MSISHEPSRIPTLSLFSGAGGLDIGFHKAGFDILACVEIEDAYCDTLEANVGTGKLFPAPLLVQPTDIRHFDASEFKGRGIECVIGGPPCQTFSAAGRRSGGVLGTSDTRGQLFKSYCNVISVLRPKVFIFENVYGLPGANGGGPWREIRKAFSSIGYQLNAEVIDSADYGVPQHRERLFLVGHRDGEFTFPLPTHGPDSPSGHPLVTVLDAIANLQPPREKTHPGPGGLYGHLLPLVPKGLNYAFFTREMGHPEPVFAWRSKFHDFLYKVDPDYPCRTIKARPGKFTGPFHWKNRHFTKEELKRLQTFPDDYELVGTPNRVLEQIGNSVPPRLAQVIATSVRQQILKPTGNLEYPIRDPEFRSTFRQRQRSRTLYFKKAATREIRNRYKTQEAIGKLKTLHETYFVEYKDFFKKSRLSDPLHGSLDDGGQAFRVSIEDQGNTLRIWSRCVRNDAKKSVRISISGLSKCLGRIDRLLAEAELSSFEDLFSIWDIIEENLTKKSNFFTLIDIYGHYANRGDTVKIRTEFESKLTNPVQRALQHFGCSENCGAFLPSRELTCELRTNAVGLRKVTKELRSMRYDLRMTATHPTIPSGQLLCTYPFPLLSNKAHLERRVATATVVYDAPALVERGGP